MWRRLQAPLIVLKAKKICRGPYKNFFVEISEFSLGLVNLMNFTFWADNNSETILDKQHILGVWSTCKT